MLEIEIAFEYFEEGLSNITKSLQEVIDLYRENYLVYYIFYNNYCIFSNIEITKSEAETLVKFIESDKGLDILYKDGIQTNYAKYIMFHEVINDKEKIITNQTFERNLEKYVHNVEKANRTLDLEKRIEQYKSKIEKLEADNNIILETKDLLEDYQKLVKNKDDEISGLKENIMQINENLEKIPAFIRNIFIRKNKLLGK